MCMSTMFFLVNITGHLTYFSFLSTMLNKMDIRCLISFADNKPDLLEIFGKTEDQIDDWRNETEACIED